MNAKRIIIDSFYILFAISILSLIFFQKKESNQLKQDSEKVNRSLLAAKAGRWHYDVHSDKLIWDDNMLELFDVKREDFSNNLKGFTDRLHPDDKQRVIDLMSEVMKNKDGYYVEYKIIRGDGKIKEILASGHVSFDGKEFAGICLPKIEGSTTP